MLQVSQLYIYPIKSLAGIALTSTTVTDRGFQYDRRWMLVDNNNRFLSQRENAAMALLQVQLNAEGLKVFHRQYPDNILSILFSTIAVNTLTVTIWDLPCTAQLVSQEADEWFSTLLGLPCRLVYMPDETMLQVDDRYSQPGDLTSFSDGFPMLMISEASLEDLNQKATEVIPMNRFRPNLVIKGSVAFEEDHMAAFNINGLSFFGVKPSSRCVVTTIDQQTAIQHKEPLKTLSGYRSRNNKIYFGENVLARGTGSINVGDTINITTTKASILNIP